MAFTARADTQANLERSNILKGSFEVSVGDTSYNQVKVEHYRDSAADWKLTTLIVNDYVKQQKAKTINDFSVNGAGFDNENQARRIANQKISELADGNSFAGIVSDREATLLEEEGDVICITDEFMDYVNEPVSVEKLTLDPASGYPTIAIDARKYRREFYNDQITERLVPLPIVQNDSINREQQAATIAVYGDITLTDVYVRITGNSDAAKFRKIVASSASDMSVVIETTVIAAADRPNQVLSDLEHINKFSGSNPIYYQVFHSSNGVSIRGSFKYPDCYLCKRIRLRRSLDRR